MDLLEPFNEMNIDLLEPYILPDILKQIEFYFSANTLDREDLMRYAIEVDCGYVAIDLLLTFNKLRELTSNATDVQKSIKNSVNLILSHDGKKIRRLTAYRLTEESQICVQGGYYKGDGGSRRGLFGGREAFSHKPHNPSSFMEAIASRRYYSARIFFKSEIFLGGSSRDRDSAEIKVLREFGSRVPLSSLSEKKDIFLTPSIFRILHAQSAQPHILLLWTAFPRILLSNPDIVHEPSIFQRPNWESHWQFALTRIEQGATKIDSSIKEVLPVEKLPPDRGILCMFEDVDAAGALLLASIFCVSSQIVVVHDFVGNVVWIEDLSLPCTSLMRLVATYRLNPRHVTTYRLNPNNHKGGAVVAGENDFSSRIATVDEVDFLRGLRPEVPCPCHIRWEFYCRELLESMEKVSEAKNAQVVAEMRNVDYSLAEGDLLRVDGVNAEEARMIACALCNSRIIVVHDHVSTIWIKDITKSGPLKADSRRTTYRILPPEGLGSGLVPQATHATQRPMTDAESRYLGTLRWKDRLPALVVAARFRNGSFFHTLKLVASFL